MHFRKKAPSSENTERETLLSMLENQIVSVEQDSVIKDMGLPVDDFGLLMVS